MPVTKNKIFKPNLFFRNKHFNTLYRYLTNKTSTSFIRERMTTSDADFIDLDVSSVDSDKVIIAIHGLEGNSQSSYIQSLTLYANRQNYDVIAMNLRGCSGEPNRLLSSYHSGKSSDLLEVIAFVAAMNEYKEIYIAGYSLGGNLALKLMGEYGDKYPSHLKSVVGVSVPCDLKGSAQVLDKGFNKSYQYGILKSLLEKAKQKLEQFPNSDIDKTKLLEATNFETFDQYFTAPLNGFKGADDYYEKSSSKQYIQHIQIPSLIISALDDSFLSETCYPYQEVKDNDNVQLLTPKHGGHVGFYSGFSKDKNFWLEKRIISFFDKSKS